MRVIAVLLALASCGPQRSGEVLAERVVDGDTIVVHGERMRLIGVDAPENGRPRPAQECHAEATAALRALLPPGTKVRLETHGRDVYKRPLVYVWAGDVLLNSEVVRSGFARYQAKGNVNHFSRFEDAQTEARLGGRGLWSFPPRCAPLGRRP